MAFGEARKRELKEAQFIRSIASELDTGFRAIDYSADLDTIRSLEQPLWAIWPEKGRACRSAFWKMGIDAAHLGYRPDGQYNLHTHALQLLEAVDTLEKHGRGRAKKLVAKFSANKPTKKENKNGIW